MRMLRRTGDDGLQGATETVLSKVTLPDALRKHLTEPPFFVLHHGAPPPPVADLAAIRAAIRGERKLRIAYGHEKGARTERTIWPFAIAYFVEATLVNAWCELRDDFRHFRADRIPVTCWTRAFRSAGKRCSLAKSLRLRGPAYIEGLVAVDSRQA